METKILQEKTFTFPFTVVFLYFLIEYSRPGILFVIRPALLLQALLAFQLWKNKGTVREAVKDRYFMLFGLLLLEMMVHGPIATNNYWALMAFLGMLSMLVFSVSIVVFADTPSKVKMLLLAIVAGHLLASTRFLPLGSPFGVTGIMGDSNDFGLSMNFVIPISFFLGTMAKGVRKAALMAATAVFVAGNVATMSRGGFLGMVTVGLFCWLSMKHKIRSLLVLFLMVGVFILLIPNDYRDEMLTIRDDISGTPGKTPHPIAGKTYGGRERLEYWGVGLRAFADHPILGVGQGNLPFSMGIYQDMQNDMWGRSISGRAVHSMYVSLIAELGLFGTAIFLLMTLNFRTKYLSVVGRHQNRKISTQEPAFLDTAIYMKAMMVSFAGFLVTGTFLSVFYYPQLWHIFALATAIWTVKRKQAVASAAPA